MAQTQLSTPDECFAHLFHMFVHRLVDNPLGMTGSVSYTDERTGFHHPSLKNKKNAVQRIVLRTMIERSFFYVVFTSGTDSTQRTPLSSN
jgi:hypothetical protein